MARLFFSSLFAVFAVLVNINTVYSQGGPLQNNRPKLKPKITLPDFRNWNLIESEKIENSKDKKLSAVVQKLKDPDDNEWIIVAKITNNETGDSWQKAFFLQLQPRKNQFDIRMLNIYHIFLNGNEWSDKWSVNSHSLVAGEKDADFYPIIDIFYSEFVAALKNLPENEPESNPLLKKASQPFGWIFYT